MIKTKTDRRIKVDSPTHNLYYDIHERIEGALKNVASLYSIDSTELADATHYLRNSQARLEESLMWLDKFYKEQ